MNLFCGYLSFYDLLGIHTHLEVKYCIHILADYIVSYGNTIFITNVKISILDCTHNNRPKLRHRNITQSQYLLNT